MATRKKTTKKSAARKRPTPRKPKAPPDPLDALAEGDPRDVIALMLWVNRRVQPDLYAQITAEDLKGFDDCVNYLGVRPTVQIHRPQGLPAQPAIPPTTRSRGVPAREAEPPRPYVIISLTDEQGNAIVPVENNQVDYDRSQDAAAVRHARDNAPDLASRLMDQAQTGEFSVSIMRDASDALLLLSRAP